MRFALFIIVMLLPLFEVYADNINRNEVLLGELRRCRSFLNIRTGPSIDYPSIGQINCPVADHKIVIIGQADNWYVIKYNGIEGYASGTYINTVYQVGEMVDELEQLPNAGNPNQEHCPEKPTSSHEPTDIASEEPSEEEPAEEPREVVTGPLWDCEVQRIEGCLYIPANVSADAELLLYYRGWWGSYEGNVPPGLSEESARQAGEYYDLVATAEATQRPIFITGSSHMRLRTEEIQNIQQRAGVQERPVAMASHSGGYVGLFESLEFNLTQENPVEIDQVVMLDNFYFLSREDRPIYNQEIELLRRTLGENGDCRGFLTDHLQQRYENQMETSGLCQVEKLGHSHNESVNNCLGNYLNGEACIAN